MSEMPPTNGHSILARAKSHNKFAHRKLSVDELLKFFGQSLDTLAELVAVYDNGYSPIVFQIAVEIQKILCEGGLAARLRGERKFLSSANDVDDGNLMPRYPLVAGRVGGRPPELQYLPAFLSPGENAEKPRSLPFREWWGREAIYRASAAEPGSAPGMIPVNDTPNVPFAKRETLTRREIIGMIRDKLGAHQDNELPTVLDDLQSGLNYVAIIYQDDDGREWHTDNGTLPISIPPIAAMVRQIAHEVLVAYDRADSPAAA